MSKTTVVIHGPVDDILELLQRRPAGLTIATDWYYSAEFEGVADVEFNLTSAPRLADIHRSLRDVARERVFILAASKEQANLFIQRWVADGSGRGIADAIYIDDARRLQGQVLSPADRVVAVEGYWRHPNTAENEQWLRHLAAKTATELVIELVTI